LSYGWCHVLENSMKHYSSLKDTIKDRDLYTEAGIRSKLELLLDPY